MITTAMTLAAIYGSASAVAAGGPPVMIQAKCTDDDGNPSGALCTIDSSDESIATVTSAEQIGNAPVGVVGQRAGSATITASAKDGSALTATLVVTVI